MTYFVTTVKGWFFKRPQASSDPVYNFFFDTSSRDRKKVYMSALRKAQTEQENVSRIAKEKARV